jgi:hypothetical protein
MVAVSALTFYYLSINPDAPSIKEAPLRLPCKILIFAPAKNHTLNPQQAATSPPEREETYFEQ